MDSTQWSFAVVAAVVSDAPAEWVPAESISFDTFIHCRTNTVHTVAGSACLLSSSPLSILFDDPVLCEAAVAVGEAGTPTLLGTALQDRNSRSHIASSTAVVKDIEVIQFMQKSLKSR